MSGALHEDELTIDLSLVRGLVGARLAAVPDFGGLAIGDPTVDLIVAWDVLDPAAREVFRRAVGVDDTSWLRGKAWALSLAAPRRSLSPACGTVADALIICMWTRPLSQPG